ncbi:MAG: hypothetical protein LBU81_05355 [Methanosarcinales archaeon]|jgi:hypothetical protein|nr:hypothetical protein [Methanosarcinales archaeon]
MERKDILKLQKLCLENNNFIAFSLAVELLSVKYADLYKFFRSGRNVGMFLLEKVGGLNYIKFCPMVPETKPPLDKGKAKLKPHKKPRTGNTKFEILGKFETLEVWCKEAEDFLITDEYEEYLELWENLAAGVASGDFVSIDRNLTKRLKVLFGASPDIVGSIESIEQNINALRPVRKIPQQVSDDLYEARYYIRKWRGWGHTELDSSGRRYFKFGTEAQKLDFESCLNCFKRWIKTLSKKSLIFLDAGGNIISKPLRTRFTDDSRKAHLREVFEDAFFAGESKFRSATFITLTTNPENFDSMDEANKAMSDNFNRFMAYLRKHFKRKSKQMPYINVREFQQNGRLHMHLVLFGISLEQNIVDHKKKIYTNDLVQDAWIRYGQGSVTDTRPLDWADDKQGLWWAGRSNKPSDCKSGESPFQYLKKYLRKVLSGNDNDLELDEYVQAADFLDDGSSDFDPWGCTNTASAIHHAKSLFQYWVNKCRFYTKSQTLVSKDFAKKLFEIKLKKNYVRRNYPIRMIGVLNLSSGIYYVSETINSEFLKDPGDFR